MQALHQQQQRAQLRGGAQGARASLSPLPSLRLLGSVAGRPSLQLARADPKVEGTREFREDTGEVSGPGKNADGSMYVDDDRPKVRE